MSVSASPASTHVSDSVAASGVSAVELSTSSMEHLLSGLPVVFPGEDFNTNLSKT